MSEFETTVTTKTKAKINAHNIASIIGKEKDRVLGGYQRQIHNGWIKESDYRLNGLQEIREATQEEVNLYEALSVTEEYFRYLNDKKENE